VIVILDPNDARAVRNKDNVLALYELMINQKKPLDAVAKFLAFQHIQHDSHIPDNAVGVAWFFKKMAQDRINPRVEIYRIIAAGDYVWAHVNFINVFNDNPQDRGIAAVDIYKMDADGKAVEHWDVLQEVRDPKNAAHANGVF